MPVKDSNIQLYEVIRIIDGIPVFLEDHLDRLYHSASLTGVKNLPCEDLLSKTIKNYLASQGKNTGNIKLSFTFSPSSLMPDLTISYIPHYYPTAEQYAKGVKVGLLKADRPVPHAKVQNPAIRDRANQSIIDQDLFEVLLVDTEGNITEGSRSNVFFIKDEMLYSAPEEKILKGITRIKILLLCQKAGIRVVETTIPADQIDQFEGAFLTGTSPKVLPIASIGEVVYKTDHTLLIELHNLYNQLIDDYLQKQR